MKQPCSGRGRAVIGLDWTLSHHEQGAKIFGVKRAYDYVEKRMSRYQTVVTAVIANRERFDGLELVVQSPNYQKFLRAREGYQSRKILRTKRSYPSNSGSKSMGN